MTNSDTVKVAVEIVDNFSDDLTELETRLEKIDGKKLDVELKIEDSEIEEVKSQLESLEKKLNTTLDIDVDGFEAAQAKKQTLSKDMNSTLHIDVDKEKGLGNLSGGEAFGPPDKSKLGGLLDQLQTRNELGLEDLIGELGDESSDSTDQSRIDPDVKKNILAAEGASGTPLGRFSDRERKEVNEWIINPDVARAHNKGIPKSERDGWIGPSNWDFGIGEPWGPEPRDESHRKGLDADMSFLRDISEATDSWDSLKTENDDLDLDSINTPLKTGFADPDSDRTAAEGDFLRSINQRVQRSRKIQGAFDRSFLDDPPSPEFNGEDVNWDLFTAERGEGDYSYSLSKRAKRTASRTSRRARKTAGTAGRTATGALGSLGNMAVEGAQLLGGNNGSDGGSRMVDNLKGSIKSAIPSMRTWYSLIGALIPVMITLAGAAFGLVAAFGALATAGIAMGGLGLLGWGGTAEESLKNVKRRLGELKDTLFGILKPVADVFQPFTAELFDKLPGMIKKFTGPLKRFEEVGFDDWWIESLEAASSWFAELLTAANDLAPQIQAVGTAFGQALGTTIINLLKWAVKEIYNNWNAYADLASMLAYLVVILYQVSKAVSFALTIFKPLLRIATAIANTFAGRVVSALLAAVVAMGALYYIGSSVAAMLGIIKGIAIAQALWSAVAATGGLMSALGALSGVLNYILTQMLALNAFTGGLLLIVGALAGYGAYKSMGPGKTAASATSGTAPASRTGAGGGSPGPGGGGTYITINGDVGDKEFQRLKDEFPSLYDEQSTVENETER